ncbi:MAG: DUF4912 domain-containing protein [Thermodesulfovibrionales bacterium]
MKAIKTKKAAAAPKKKEPAKQALKKSVKTKAAEAAPKKAVTPARKKAVAAAVSKTKKAVKKAPLKKAVSAKKAPKLAVKAPVAAVLPEKTVKKKAAKKPALKTTKKAVAKPKKKPAAAAASKAVNKTVKKVTPAAKASAAKKPVKAALKTKKVAAPARPKKTVKTVSRSKTAPAPVKEKSTKKVVKTTAAPKPLKKTLAKPAAIVPTVKKQPAVKKAMPESIKALPVKAAKKLPADKGQAVKAVDKKITAAPLSKPGPVPVVKTGAAIKAANPAPLKPFKQAAQKPGIKAVPLPPLQRQKRKPAVTSVKPLEGKTSVKPAALRRPLPELLSVAEMEARDSKKRPLKIFLPSDDLRDESERSYTTMKPAGLPEEYGENSLLLMVVDPQVIYINWEILNAEIPAENARLAVRIYDVTGKDTDDTDHSDFLDILIDRRIGSGYFGIMMPGKVIIAEIGILAADGTFRSVLRSSRVSLPHQIRFDELGIAKKLLEAGIPVGY